MANLNVTIQGFITLIDGYLKDLHVDNKPVPISSGKGWPPEPALTATCKTRKALISVIERLSLPDTDHHWPIDVATINHECGIESELNKVLLSGTGSATLTLTGTPLKNDAVSFYMDRNGQRKGVVAISVGGTLTALAVALCAAINTEPDLKDWVLASNSGAVVTITGKTSALTKLYTAFGNNATTIKEVGRGISDLQVTCWAGTSNINDAIFEIFEPEFTDLVRNGGIPVVWKDYLVKARLVRISRGLPLYGDLLSDLYRHDFIVNVDYPILKEETVYPVLVPLGSLSNF